MYVIEGPGATAGINVKSPGYNAKGDGVTDDTAALQAAVNDASSAHTSMYLPAGTYIVSAPIVIPAGEGLTILGSGWGTRLKLKANRNCYILKMTGADTRITMRDLTIDGNCLEQGTPGTSGGIDAGGAVACRFDNLHFTGCRDNALYLHGMTAGAFGHNNRITGCLFDQSIGSSGPGRGIHMDSNDENQVEFCDFEYLGGAGGVGPATASMIFDQCGTQFISDCNFVNGGHNAVGVRVQDTKSTKISDCNFDGTAGTSIFLAAQRCIVTGNTIFSPGHAGTAGLSSGIHLEYAATDNIVMSNVITSDPTNGVSRGAIREASDGGAGRNNISDNTIVTSGTWSFAAFDLSGTGSRVRGNLGSGVSDPSTGGRALGGARYVVASNASAAEKAIADYQCDGTADNVEIQAAIAAAQAEGGGVVQLSPGNFNIAAPLVVNGVLDENDPRTITLKGCGQQVTELTVAANVVGISISNWAQIHLEGIGIFISGSGIGIKSVGVDNVSHSNNISFWHSSFKNLRINGGFVATDTVWGMELGMPWRSTFENIEIEGCRNGIKIINNATMQNAGDCVFSRFFVEIVGTGGYALYVDSQNGNMNQNTWIDFEAGANSTGCTGIWLGGTVGTASQKFIGNLNLEQFQTLINVANGNSNLFDCNYITCDSGGATNKGFVTGTDAYNNTFRSAYFNIGSGDTVKVIEDGNTTSNAPNIYERIRIENNTGSTVTYSRQNSTVLRDITTFNTGTVMPAGLLQYPLTVVNNPTFTPADHGLISWAFDPSATRSTGDNITSGTVYLCKIKIVDRSTVVSNVLFSILNTPTLMTAAQNFVGLYDSSGTRLAVSADQSANWLTAGLKTTALTSPVTLAVGSYYVAILMNSTGTVPQLLQGNGASASALNAGLSVATARFINTAAGNTTLPTSITLSAQSTNAGSRWVAVS